MGAYSSLWQPTATHVPITDWQRLVDIQTTISLTYGALYRQHSVLALSNWVDTIATSLTEERHKMSLATDTIVLHIANDEGFYYDCAGDT